MKASEKGTFYHREHVIWLSREGVNQERKRMNSLLLSSTIIS